MDKNKLPHNHGEETNQILKNLPETKDFEKISELFKPLGDSKRVKTFHNMLKKITKATCPDSCNFLQKKC